MKTVRLQKFLADAGLTSRRAAEDWIRQGRVTVNGKRVTEMGVRVNPDCDEVRVDGHPVSPAATRLYVVLNKPRSCLTTARDPRGRPTVFDHLPDFEVRLFPVGRLDWDASGLLLLTNDGPLAHRLMHPRHGIPKKYEVKVQGHPSDETLELLRRGVMLPEGRTAPARVRRLKELPKATWLEIVIHQGWYRQIKRMGEAVGHPVVKIHRTGYGPLSVEGLAAGKWRHLSREEVRGLRRAAFGEEETQRGISPC